MGGDALVQKHLTVVALLLFAKTHQVIQCNYPPIDCVLNCFVTSCMVSMTIITQNGTVVFILCSSPFIDSIIC